MKTFNDLFLKAAFDYVYLTDRKYPGKAILELVGRRYGLSGQERIMLYRGVFSLTESRSRQHKLKVSIRDTEQPLYIDGYNQLFTLAAYLNGDVVFESTDAGYFNVFIF